MFKDQNNVLNKFNFTESKDAAKNTARPPRHINKFKKSHI